MRCFDSVMYDIAATKLRGLVAPN